MPNRMLSPAGVQLGAITLRVFVLIDRVCAALVPALTICSDAPSGSARRGTSGDHELVAGRVERRQDAGQRQLEVADCG